MALSGSYELAAQLTETCPFPPWLVQSVAAPPPKPFDDEALLEYQRRLDRIIEEAAE
jgi:hypothetical protein